MYAIVSLDDFFFLCVFKGEKKKRNLEDFENVCHSFSPPPGWGYKMGSAECPPE